MASITSSQPIRFFLALWITRRFHACEPARDRMVRVPMQFDHARTIHGDVQSACIRTIQRAHRRQYLQSIRPLIHPRPVSPAKPLFDLLYPEMVTLETILPFDKTTVRRDYHTIE